MKKSPLKKTPPQPLTPAPHDAPSAQPIELAEAEMAQIVGGTVSYTALSSSYKLAPTDPCRFTSALFV